MNLVSKGVLGAVLLLPVTVAVAQKAQSVQLPAQKRVVAGPALDSAVRNLAKERQRLRELEQHMELLLADARDVARGIRESAVGTSPALDGVGKSPARGTGRAGDRIGAGSGAGAAGSQYENPMGSSMSDIDGRLRGNKPRSSAVGPGGIPDSRGVASSGGWVTTQRWKDGQHTGVTTTTRDPRSEATVQVTTVARESKSGRLSSWSTTTIDNMGNETTKTRSVEYRGAGQTPVVTEETVLITDDGNSLQAYESDSPRPYDADVDPPISEPGRGSQPAEEGTVGGMRNFNGPLGITCNPITGVCGPGLKLGSAQVNPGRIDGQSAVGPRLRLDPRAPVINPDPNALENASTPNAIDRDGKGPGAIPPKPR